MHKTVEQLIGRLATDPRLHQRFAADAAGLLEELVARGLELSAVEQDALASLDPQAIAVFARALDRRLRRAAMTTPEEDNR